MGRTGRARRGPCVAALGSSLTPAGPLSAPPPCLLHLSAPYPAGGSWLPISSPSSAAAASPRVGHGPGSRVSTWPRAGAWALGTDARFKPVGVTPHLNKQACLSLRFLSNVTAVRTAEGQCSAVTGWSLAMGH